MDYENPNIMIDRIYLWFDTFDEWKYPSNKNMSLQFLENHLIGDWDWYYIANNPNITTDFLERI